MKNFIAITTLISLLGTPLFSNEQNEDCNSVDVNKLAPGTKEACVIIPGSGDGILKGSVGGGGKIGIAALALGGLVMLSGDDTVTTTTTTDSSTGGTGGM